MTHRISFVSDLHLFARRSDAPRYVEAIRTAARRSAVLVLGGDIFDFSWSTLPTVEDTVSAAFHWLQHLAAENPQCQIHYLLGNHDYCQPFLEFLEQHAHLIPNFAWHHFYLRLGPNIFLHGDAVEKKETTHEKLLKYRSHWLHKPMAGKFSRGAYAVRPSCAIAQALGLFSAPQAPRGAANLELPRTSGGAAGDGGAARLFRAHSPPHVQLSLSRGDLSQLRRADCWAAISHSRRELRRQPADSRQPPDGRSEAVRNPRAEIRNPKSEIRNKSEIQRKEKKESKEERQTPHFEFFLCVFCVLNISHLDFGFVSNFGFRISNFSFVF